MRLVRRPAALMAATCLAISGLSACAGQGEGEETSSTTVSPLPGDSTTSSSSSATSSTSSSSSSTKGGDAAPELPAAAKKHTKEGAVAFAKFYWEETGRAQESGDTNGLSELISPDCTVCHSLIDDIDKDHDKGIHADRSPTKVTLALIATTTDGKSDEAATLNVTDQAHNFVDGAEAVGHVKETKYKSIVYVDWDEGSWVVVDTFIIT